MGLMMPRLKSILIQFVLLVPAWIDVLGQSSSVLDDTFDFSNPAYWDARYAKQAKGSFEWYGLGWRQLNATLAQLVPKDSRVMHLGTGNSPLPEQMHRNGYTHQVAIDISETVVTQMQARFGHLAPALEFKVDDALRTRFPPGSFDAVLEKGTMEAVAAERDCALAQADCEPLVAEKSVALEAMRLLTPGGLFLSVADEFKPFAELWKAGLDRVEQLKLDEKDGIPVPKGVFLCFKKADTVEL